MRTLILSMGLLDAFGWSPDAGARARARSARNVEGEEAPTHAFLLESSLDVDGHHVVFGCAEYVRKAGHDLVLPEPLEHSVFDVGSLVLGYVYNLGPVGPVRPGVGGAAC